ncbi:Ribosomal large subunit pseudouridine synthase C [Candidatus Arsenophonus lipoptenae]|uniref:Pseudouridine synthase n=1 Tax=Candidatus Arsenophonus lipoptenae TaxID=634113 RepID=A0A0X8CXA8_9GAMM|nr:23S rRNA pseudouridine(955/2504/2580) synthase RluC [Candidatus Arsenophonus lipoptenae]AMA64662.1 Ribosomal large subunit pseudouridine synthase C [Candidatus Arsenophonus lipoptenae]
MTTKNQVQFIIINNEESGQRIDNFLLARLKGIPRSRIYRIIRKGEIRINSCRTKPEYKIKIKDIIRIPPIIFFKKPHNIVHTTYDKVSKINNCILYEDEYILVLNKPSSIATHGGSGINFGIIEALRTLRPKEHFLHLVHRLDRETSGVLLTAKKYSSLKLLHQQLRLRNIQKTYIALVKGQWPEKIKVIKAPLLKKNLKNNNKKIVTVSDNGKYSETHFKIKECFSNATLVQINPITGRTHQIRVHAKYAQHPIAFDNRYGDLNFNKQLIFTGLNRLFLHASSLMFFHPVSGEKLTFNAPLDKQLNTCLKLLRKYNI